MACSTSETKILPSPILSVLAAATMASTAPVDLIVRQHDLDLHLGQEVDDVFRAAVQFGVPLLAAEALDLADGQALHAKASCSASFTSSSLKGLMIASIFFMTMAAPSGHSAQ